MDLRWKLVVVLGGGSGVGHEIGLRLARAGAGVLVVDPRLADAEATADLLRGSRVAAWSMQARPADDADLVMVADRARDLGGADLLVVTGVAPDRARAVARTLLGKPRLVGVLADEAQGGAARTAVAVVDLLRARDVGTAVVVG